MNQRIMSIFNMFDDYFGLAEVISIKATQESLPKQGLRTVSMPLPYWVEELVESGKILKVQVEAALAKGSRPRRRAFKLCNFAPVPYTPPWCSYCKGELHLVPGPRGKTTCPKEKCPICQATGDFGHTANF